MNYFCKLNQNISMSTQNALLCIIPAIVILIFVFPIVVELRLSYNPFQNTGTIAVYWFRMKLKHYVFNLHMSYIVFENDKERKIQKLSFSGEDFEVLKEFAKEVEDKVKLKKLYVFYNLGALDAFSGAIIAGVINQLCVQTFLFLKNKKPTASMCVYDNVCYNKHVCEVAIKSKISISIFELIYSWVYAFLKTKYNI